MAKIPFTKLKLKLNIEEIPVKAGEEEILIKQYLPLNDKLALIGRVIQQAHMQDENFSNPVKAAAFKDLEIVEAYTNITFTDKQKEDPAKLYDLLDNNGVFNVVFGNIPKAELDIIGKGVKETIEAVYKYQNSIFGILDNLGNNYENLDEQLQEIAEKTSNPEALKLVKNVLTKLN